MKRLRKPIASRQLTWHADGCERAVLIRIWQPIIYKRDIYCDYAIDGLGKPVRGASMGGDSLQALTLALQVIRLELAPLRKEVYWNAIPGWLGLSFSFDYPEDFTQQLRVERLVEIEEKRYFDRTLGPHRRREARLRKRYDPDDGQVEYAQSSPEEILEEFRVAAAREKCYWDEKNEEGALFYYSKSWSIAAALGKRPDRQALLERMSGEQSPRLRLLAAELLDASAVSDATLTTLRDAKIEPEASEARRIIRIRKFRQRMAARPRPWDDEG